MRQLVLLPRPVGDPGHFEPMRAMPTDWQVLASVVVGRPKPSRGWRNGVVRDGGLCEGLAGFVGLGRVHGARDDSTDGRRTLGLRDVRGNAVQSWCTMPENGIDVSDPGSGDGPSLGTGIRRTTLPFVSIGIVLLRSIVRVEYFEWFILCQCASWSKQVEEGIARHRAVVSHRISKASRCAREAFFNVVSPHEQVEKSPFGGCMRVVLGSKIDGNGIGGRVFDRGAGRIVTGRGIRYRRCRISFGRMAWVVGGGESTRRG